MKSSLKIKSIPPKSKPSFPVLARLLDKACSDTHRGTVVLFTAVNQGFVVHSPKSGRTVGATDNWVHVTDTNVWEILPKGAAVTLVQE